LPHASQEHHVHTCSARRARNRVVVASLVGGILLLPAATGLASAAADGTAPVAVAAPVDVAAIVETADGHLVVEHVLADGRRHADALAQRWSDDDDVVAAAVVQPMHALELDPRRGDQWGMTMLSAEKAWAVGPASSQLVAVLDTGVDARHPDLAGVVTPGTDIVSGGDGTHDPNGHGTHVAGVIAAVAGNGAGGAGLAQGARVLPVRVLDQTGWGSDANVAQGVLWAVDHGATVLNLSLAGDRPSALLTSALEHAMSRGVLVVAGSGNSGDKGDPVLYPAANPGVLAVGAVNRDDVRPSWSSSGSHLSLVAPGASVVSTVPGGGYEAWTGTSMASPFVAAAAALLKHAEPKLTPAQVRSRLMATARDLGAPGHDPLHGAGRLDVVAALAAGPAAAPSAPAPVGAVATAPVVTAPVMTAPAVSAPVTSVPAVTAPKATVTTPQVPVLSLRAAQSATSVKQGAPVTYTVRTLAGAAPKAGVAVLLERRIGTGSWAVLRRGTSGAGGLLSLRIAADRTSELRFRSGSALSPVMRLAVAAR
jgi:type VII secretion-associated serine protease mycosin